jgi:hypothetical protein
MPEMSLTPYSTITNNNEQRTMNSLKQTQTKPILPALVAGKIALSETEGPVNFALPALRSFSEGGSEGGGTAEGPCRTIYSIFIRVNSWLNFSKNLVFFLDIKTKRCYIDFSRLRGSKLIVCTHFFLFLPVVWPPT